MTFPKARAVVAACLFVAWLGFLLFLVLERKRVILSPPQFLIAQAIVIAELKDANGSPESAVVIKEVLWPKDRRLTKVELLELPDFGKAKGYHGGGAYLIPLLERNGHYAISPRPTFAQGAPLPWIYPWTAETQAQVEEIIAAKDHE